MTLTLLQMYTSFPIKRNSTLIPCMPLRTHTHIHIHHPFFISFLSLSISPFLTFFFLSFFFFSLFIPFFFLSFFLSLFSSFLFYIHSSHLNSCHPTIPHPSLSHSIPILLILHHVLQSTTPHTPHPTPHTPHPNTHLGSLTRHQLFSNNKQCQPHIHTCSPLAI